MAVSLPYPSLSSPPVKGEIEANFAAIAQKFGGFDASDLAMAAGITSTQLAQPYQDAIVTLGVRAESLAGGWPGAATYVDAVVVPGINDVSTTDPEWKVVQVHWSCTDTGAGTGVFSLRWGHFDTGSYTTITTILAGASIVNTGGANASWAEAAISSSYGSGITLPFGTTPRSLALVGTTADATALSAAGSFFNCAVVLRRALRSD